MQWFFSQNGKSLSSKQTVNFNLLKSPFKAHKYYQLHKSKKVFMDGDISEQTCCSSFYSKVFGRSKCCCTWLDNGEIFQASLKESKIKF